MPSLTKNKLQRTHTTHAHACSHTQPLVIASFVFSRYLIVDSEEDFFEEEVEKIYKDVTEKGLSVVVVSEWYDPAEIEKVRFFDDNTKSHWDAVTGGGNVPALNSMLAPFKLRLGDRAYKGTVKSKAASYTFGSGNVIVQAPEGSFLLEGQLSPVNMKKTSRRGRAALSLGAKDSAEEEAGEEEEGSSRSLLAGNQVAYASATGFEGGKTKGSRNGWVVIYGDASCSDTNHRQGSDCSPWIAEMVFMAAQGQRDADVFPDSSRSVTSLLWQILILVLFLFVHQSFVSWLDLPKDWSSTNHL